MFKIALTGLALAIAAPVAASETITLPPQNSTFSTNARGYWFTAPVDFVMRGILVPTDASSGAQSVAVMRFNGAPPLYSNTTNDFDVLHLTQNLAGTAEIPLAIQFFAGDIVGILGVRNDVNSYANTNYVTSLGGNDITLRRLGMQFSLSNTAPKDLWTENGGSISRVFFSYDVGQLTGAVPEPSTWAMLILGFGSVGATMRRRSGATRTTLSYA